MSVTLINEFRAAEGRSDDLRGALSALLPKIRVGQGCESVHLLENETDPTRFVVIEVWRDRESHRVAASDLPAASLQRIMVLLAEMPSGNYYVERH